MKKIFRIKLGIFDKCFNIIAFSALGLVFVMNCCRDTYTPENYISELYRQDSISVARNKLYWAKNFVDSCIKAKPKIVGKATEVDYDSNMKAYRVKYRYTEWYNVNGNNKVADKDIKHMTVWLQYELQRNYKIKIKKLKSEKLVYICDETHKDRCITHVGYLK